MAIFRILRKESSRYKGFETCIHQFYRRHEECTASPAGLRNRNLPISDPEFTILPSAQQTILSAHAMRPSNLPGASPVYARSRQFRRRFSCSRVYRRRVMPFQGRQYLTSISSYPKEFLFQQRQKIQFWCYTILSHSSPFYSILFYTMLFYNSILCYMMWWGEI